MTHLEGNKCEQLIKIYIELLEMQYQVCKILPESANTIS